MLIEYGITVMNIQQPNINDNIRIVPKNQYIYLNNPNVIWIVRQGNVRIFSSRYAQEEPIGRRDEIIEISAGGVLFGCNPSIQPNQHAWLGVAETDVILQKINYKELMGLLRASERAQHSLLGQWTENIGHFLKQNYPPATSFIRMQIETEYSFGLDDIFCGPIDHGVLIKIKDGRLSVFGKQTLSLGLQDQWFLLCEGCWIQVTSETAQIQMQFISQIQDSLPLLYGITSLNRIIELHLNILHQQADEKELERQKLRSQQEKLATETVVREMQSILHPQEYYPRCDSDLVTAMSIVGTHYGIKIQPPSLSEDMTRVSNPIEAIARASKIRIRKVILGPDWYKADTGALLAYFGSSQIPVALLPTGHSYDIVFPATLKREPLTSNMLEELDSEAYMIYKPLADKLNGIKELLRFTISGKVSDLIFVVIMGVIATLLGMIVPKVTGALVDVAIPNADKNYVGQLCIILTAVGIAVAIFTLIQVLTTVRFSIRTELDGQSALWDRLLKFSPKFFRRYSSGDLETRVNAVGDISRDLSAATIKPLISGVLALLNFLLLWYYSWDLAKIALWFGLFILLIILFSGSMVRKIAKKLYELDGKYNGLVIQIIGGIAKIRVAGSEQRAFNHWLKLYIEKLRITLRMRCYRDIVTIMNNVLPPVCSAFIFWRATKLILDVPYTDPTRLSMGDFIAFNTAFTLYLTGWSDLSSALVQVLDSISKGDRIKPLLIEEPEVPVSAADPGRLKGNIRLDDITFRYHADGPAILDNVSCEIHAGEYVAFVGPSGSGKSTLLRIILGFETPEYGRVLYDGQDLAGLDMLAVRRQLGTVLQNGRLNAGNIAENISNNAKMSQLEIWDAAKDAGLEDDINAMPMGLHTMVSEGGTNLSGGQRQRLLIARALAIRPKIVLFDEATSALDNKTQSIVSQALDKRKVTRVVVAHRLSTIINADRIYVLDQGKIIQCGTYEELMKENGLFKELVSRQIV